MGGPKLYSGSILAHEQFCPLGWRTVAVRSSYPSTGKSSGTMPYVPPHLRNSAASANGGVVHSHSRQLKSSFGKFVGENGGYSMNSGNGGSRNFGNYITWRTIAVPEPVFPQWKPSDRVISLKPEQSTCDEVVEALVQQGLQATALSYWSVGMQFLVAQIKKVIEDVDSGNDVSFVVGKTARRKEKEALAAPKDAKVDLSKPYVVGSATINVEDKYRHMFDPAVVRNEGAAYDAWDD